MTLKVEDTSIAQQILGRKGVAGLNFLWLELTNACNLECGHCYAGSSPTGGRDDRVSGLKYLEILRSAAELGCAKVQFIGGEATLHPMLPEMMAECRALDFQSVEVFTNLVSLKPALIECFVEYGISIATSFYSVDPAVHDTITKRPGSWKRTVTNLKAVLAAGLSCRVGVVVSELNEADLERTEQFLVALGIDRSAIGRDRVRAFGRAGSGEGVEEMSSLCGSCAGDVVCVGYDGRVSPCIMSKRWSAGDINQQSLSDILTSSELERTREAIHLATADDRRETMGTCNPDCAPCSPKQTGPCNPQTYCHPSQAPNCIPKY